MCARLKILPLFSPYVLFAIVALVYRTYESPLRLAAHRRLIYTASFAASCAMALFAVAGCGGGGAAAAQTAPITQQAVTPQGTSLTSVTLTATTSSGKQLPAVPVQLTLTVK